MTSWTETFRGTVPPWECDLTEHFTVASYFDRLEEAEANLADELGLGAWLRPANPPRQIIGRFERELRAGESFHVESAVISVDDCVRLGHRFVDSGDGAVVTWFDEYRDLPAAPLTSRQRDVLESRLAAWTGPALEPRPEPATTDGFIGTARGRVKPGDVNAAGHFGLGAMVSRFSGAAAQLSAAIGLDRASMQQQRRGFSTFEQILQLSDVLRLDAPYRIETGIGHLGNSSLRMIHRMTDPRTGAEVGRLSQYGVNLDLDTRRPARWPDDIRGRAAALVVPGG
ncbi:MAG: thioesterase family protein [Rhodopila sp.]